MIHSFTKMRFYSLSADLVAWASPALREEVEVNRHGRVVVDQTCGGLIPAPQDVHLFPVRRLACANSTRPTVRLAEAAGCDIAAVALP